MTQPAPRLLNLACSRCKLADLGPLPAVERYNGPAFRLYRRFLRSRVARAPELHILSAEFGLVPADALIPWYDHRMTSRRARELQPGVAESLGGLLGDGCV